MHPIGDTPDAADAAPSESQRLVEIIIEQLSKFQHTPDKPTKVVETSEQRKLPQRIFRQLSDAKTCVYCM